MLLVSFGYFYEGGGWNQNTRFDLVRAIVEEHTVRIDLYHENTGDKAQVGPHFYLDKAPGASLTAVPAVAIVRGAMRAVHAPFRSRGAIVAYSYVATLAAAGLPSVLAAVCVFWIARRFGADDAGASVAAIVCGLGTPLWAYATLFYGHALAAGCLVAALAVSLRLTDPVQTRDLWLAGWLTGLSAGWAVVTEYPAAIPSTIIVVFALWMQWRHRPSRLLATFMSMGTGVAISAAILVVYNWIAFGALVYIPYASEQGSYDAMRTGIFGVNMPSLDTARELFLGSYRGLLPLAPVLALTPVGYWFVIRDARTRAAAIIAAACALSYILLASGYAYWSGGWSYGSRHLGPALPFLCLGLAPLWMRGGRVVRAAILALALVGIGESLIAVATTPQPPNDVMRPMAELLWPAFKSGDFPISWQSYFALRPPGEPMSVLEARGVPRASWNLGQLMGLSGFASLLPLAAVWLAGIVAWVGAGRRRPQPRTTIS